MKDTIKGAIVATSVAALMGFGCASKGGDSGTSATSQPASGGDMVHCAGVNECKGNGACGGADHDCAGKNECKGKGWIKLTADECTAKSGTVVSG